MPRKAKVSKEDIIKVATDMICEGENLNARAIASKLGCSIQPIFYNFATMDVLKAEIFKQIAKTFDEYVANEMKNSTYPPFKAIGIAYIGFARDYPRFFKIAYMDEKGSNVINSGSSAQKSAIDILTKTYSCSVETAMRLQLEMWVFVHGFATMIATKYIEWDEESVSEMLTDVFDGLKLKLNLNA